MEIQFESSGGNVRFFGGGSVGDWHILDVEGLALPPIETKTVTYYGEHGQETVNKRLTGRTITLTAEVKGRSKEERAMIVSKTLKALYNEGVLSVRSYCEKVADCYLKSVKEGERDGNFRKYVFQFVCDSPYFRDKKITTVYLYNKEDLLKDGFVIGDGIVLTRRTSNGTITNKSDMEIRGVLEVASGTYEGYIYLYFFNEDLSHYSELKIYVQPGEVYIINPEEGTITDKDGNNRVDILGAGYMLSSFKLVRGVNNFYVRSPQAEHVDVTATVSFYNQYVEATD